MIRVTIEVSTPHIAGKDPIVSVAASLSAAIARETQLTVHRMEIEDEV